MNKIFKYILIGIGIISLGFASFSNAFDLTFISSGYYSSSVDTYLGISGQVVCAHTQSSYNQLSISGVSIPQYNISCAKAPVNIKGRNINYVIYDIDCGTCPSCPTCDDPYTSLECQSEYNLIPINQVTANYCHINFGMIDPQECPINSGTGAINRSSLFINNIQYASNDEINVSIPNDIGYSIQYNSGETNIDIEGYNADTTYIEDIIQKEKLTPTTEDFEYMIKGLTVFIPYLFIALIILFMVKVIKRIWK